MKREERLWEDIIDCNKHLMKIMGPAGLSIFGTRTSYQSIV